MSEVKQIRASIYHRKIGNSFHCVICNQICSNAASIRRHVKIVHYKEKKFACPKCGTKVSAKANLARHVCRNGDTRYRSREYVIQQKVAELTNGKKQVICEAGCIDVLTPTHLIEIKFINHWREAIGQVLSYGMCYPNHKLHLHFFGENPSETLVKQILAVCEKYKIGVSWEP